MISNYDIYYSNGIIYLFSLSSIYISIYIKRIIKLLKKLKISSKISIFIIILFLSFLFFINSSISILKTLILFVINAINIKYKLKIKRQNILYIVFLIMIIINPRFIFNNGFKLSFIVSFFNYLYIDNNKKISLFKLSIISFLSSFILIINNNYEINILSFVISIIFIYIIVNILYPLVFITIIAPKISFILGKCLEVLDYISIIINNYLRVTIYFQKITIIEILVYYLILFLMVKKYNKLKYALLLFIIFLYIKPYFNNNAYVYFLDVNQGDSALIVTNNNKSILIDTGGIASYDEDEWKKKHNEFNIMTSNIIPFFKSIGLKRIDYILLSHGDFDHMGEAINLVNNFKVGEIIFNCDDFNDLEINLINELNKKKIKYDSCINELDIDNNRFQFLHTKKYDNENDNSNVIITELNGYKFLFMGDASISTEKELLKKYDLSNVDVLKVGHHGSKTSSSKEFINKINPKYSIISVGKNNRYGHPEKQVLDNLDNSKIYRTDTDGSIMFKIKNNKLKVEICVP